VARFRVSTQVLVTASVLAPIALLAGALALLVTTSTDRIARDLGARLLQSTRERISERVDAQLGAAVRISDAYTDRVRLGTLSTQDLLSWERPMLHDMLTNPDIASISFGAVDGDCTWLLRRDGRLELGRVRLGAPDATTEHTVSSDGAIDPQPIRTYTYDPRTRPWYQTALDHNGPTWTPVYFWFGAQGADSEAGTGYTRAIRDGAGNLLGVLVVDITLGGMSDDLARMPIAETGAIFVIDDTDHLVAASSGGVNTDAGTRRTLADSPLPLARAAVDILDPRTTSSRGVVVTGARVQRISAGDEHAWAIVSRITPHPGIDWRILAVLPESDLLGDALADRRRAIAVTTGVGIAGALLAWFVSRSLGGVFRSLHRHVSDLAQGRYDTRLNLGAAPELAQLSTDLNTLSADLRRRAELHSALAMARTSEATARERASSDALLGELASTLLGPRVEESSAQALARLARAAGASGAWWAHGASGAIVGVPTPTNLAADDAMTIERWARITKPHAPVRLADVRAIAWPLRSQLEGVGALALSAIAPGGSGGVMLIAWPSTSPSIDAATREALDRAAGFLHSAWQRADVSPPSTLAPERGTVNQSSNVPGRAALARTAHASISRALDRAESASSARTRALAIREIKLAASDLGMGELRRLASQVERGVDGSPDHLREQLAALRRMAESSLRADSGARGTLPS
jgi:HAMP domain-containing protein